MFLAPILSLAGTAIFFCLRPLEPHSQNKRTERLCNSSLSQHPYLLMLAPQLLPRVYHDSLKYKPSEKTSVNPNIWDRECESQVTRIR